MFIFRSAFMHDETESSETRVHRSARRLAGLFARNWTSLHVPNAFRDAMAPKAMDRAYVTRDDALPDVCRDDWNEIARFLAQARQLTHSGRAPARLRALGFGRHPAL